MSSDQIEELLENRHTTWLEYSEPWTGCGPEGNDLPAHVYIRLTVHDCININRHKHKRHGGSKEFVMMSDTDHLVEFVMMNGARVVKQ